MAKPIIVGNWKNYVTSLKEGRQLFRAIDRKLPKPLKATVVICPPFTLLDSLSRGYRGSRIAFGAQNIFHEGGAHTGEVSAALVKDTKAKYVIVGHAERRALGETDEIVAKKVGAALDMKLTPIVAVGESMRDKEGHYLKELEESILNSLSLVGPNALKKIVIAYEPVWAIGAPLPPNGRTIRESIIFIRKVLASRYDRSDVLKVKIIYGGAVNEDTVDELVAESGANGFLPGRASTDADSFVNIVRAFEK